MSEPSTTDNIAAGEGEDVSTTESTVLQVDSTEDTAGKPDRIESAPDSLSLPSSVQDERSVSTVSLAGSFAVSPNSSTNVHQMHSSPTMVPRKIKTSTGKDSPNSHYSQKSRHRSGPRPSSPTSVTSRKSGAKRSGQHSLVDRTSKASSLNFSVHMESMEHIPESNSNDDFHQPLSTVICPAPVNPQSLQAGDSKKQGRFMVSPAQSIPTSQSLQTSNKNIDNHTPRSESSYAHSTIPRHSPEPEMQFHMSEMSLHHVESDRHLSQADQNRPLLQDYDVTALEPKQGDPDNMVDMDYLTDYIRDVDENQLTVRSNFSVNTQDSATYRHATLKCGNISFVKDSAELEYELKKHYLCVGYDTKMQDVTEFMARFWGMKNPNIVLSVISSVENFKPWKSQRLKDDFQKGILKAADTTDMWIITNGIDGGIPKIIGDAVNEHNKEQFSAKLFSVPMLSNSEIRRRRLTLIGIVPKDSVPYGIFFDGTEGVQITNNGSKPGAEVHELNPDHSHFIMVEEDEREVSQGNMRCMIEEQFRHKICKKKRFTRLMSIGSDTGFDDNPVENEHDFIPVVGLLVQGSPKNIDQILFYLQNKMPIVVLKGSGGIADMLAYVFEEMHEKADSDPDYEENFLKPELIKMIMRFYASYFDDNELGKFTFRDKLIQCVKLAVEGDPGSDNTYMTIVNMKGWGNSMKDLDKYILRALFKSERRDTQGLREQLQNDLKLTVDWNRPDLAWEIFQQDFTKVRIDKKMFEKALLQKDREDFIELFVSQGVKVHKYLNHKKLKLLFEKAEDREFFCNVCLEGVLGLNMRGSLPDQALGDDFLSEHLNKLIYKLSWITNFIQPIELSMSATGMYKVNAIISERKAINSLMVWAVLMNRHKLAKKLWNMCDQPIGMALICSRIYRELSKYPMEQHVKTELEENAQAFGEMALGVLAICWRDSSVQAYHKLGERAPDFNDKSVIEIAHDAGYIHFLAHPCCQKWLTKKFHGHLHFKELNWGFFRLPLWFKILASVFLIFPMFLWITFTPPTQKKTSGLDEEDEEIKDSESEDDDEILPHVTKSTLENIMMKEKKRTVIANTLKSVLQFRKPKRDVPFHQKIYLLWTAPITKFWMTQLLYFAYLGVFCLATLWPTCGNQILDMILWLWTAVIEMELVCRVYRKYHKYKTLSLLGNCIDILLILTFLILLLMTRIMQTWISLTDYLQARTIMCYGLIYFFYRLLGVYLPISPTLGPMLLRISRMVKHDFVAFVRMFLIFMIAGGVTIQAIVYPNWPLSASLIKRVITRPIYGMFLTQIDDLDGNATCKGDYLKTRDYCHSPDMYTGSSQLTIDPRMQNVSTCSVSSFSGYVITLQYLLICKLVLITLLFAMFALTISKVDLVASDIWKFQRYALIADFIERFSLPPPFTVISFVYLILQFIYLKCKYCKQRCVRWCCPNKEKRSKSHKHKVSSLDTTVFWKKAVREYTATEEAKIDNDSLAHRQNDILISLQEDLRTHRKSMKRLNDRVMELERMMQSSRVYLEDISHKLEKSDVMGITNVKGRFIHVAARQSPYPATSFARFPVFDKYVPWEAQYDVYDPKTYTLGEDKFPETETIYVDPDMIELIRLREERLAAGNDDEDSLTPIPEFKPKWNSVTSFKVKGEKREIDRRSWINIDDQPLRYVLDSLGIPLNPMGRTGLRGKGNLWRWGPNHVIKAVITRWRRKYGPDLNTMTDFLYVEGKRVLEFITVQKDTVMDSSYALPGDILHGLSNPSSILCRSFMSQVFDEQDSEQYKKFDQMEMIEFFAQFASSVVGGSITTFQPSDNVVNKPGYLLQPMLSESRTNLRTDTDQSGFSASLIYKGYLDDPRNTDNAWVEAEVWNFHYDMGDTFDLSIAEGLSVKWKEVSPYVKMFGNETVIVQEAARIHDAYH